MSVFQSLWSGILPLPRVGPTTSCTEKSEVQRQTATILEKFELITMMTGHAATVHLSDTSKRRHRTPRANPPWWIEFFVPFRSAWCGRGVGVEVGTEIKIPFFRQPQQRTISITDLDHGTPILLHQCRSMHHSEEELAQTEDHIGAFESGRSPECHE